MGEATEDTKRLQNCLTRFVEGDEGALNELLTRTSARLEHLTRAMFQDISRVHRCKETADVLQSASIRLYRALYRSRREREAAAATEIWNFLKV